MKWKLRNIISCLNTDAIISKCYVWKNIATCFFGTWIKIIWALFLSKAKAKGKSYHFFHHRNLWDCPSWDRDAWCGRISESEVNELKMHRSNDGHDMTYSCSSAWKLVSAIQFSLQQFSPFCSLKLVLNDLLGVSI